MIKLKAHSKTLSKFSKIDKFFLVTKKQWDYFPLGENQLVLNGIKIRVWIHDVPCDCSGEMHYHRIGDLRDVWNNLNLQNNQDIEIKK